MIPRPCVRLLALAALAGASLGSAAPFLDWPEPHRENRPWTRWWWPGSAVDDANLTRQLEQFARVGLGGVEITPIYGAQGEAARAKPFLSAPWIAALSHTGREAQRLGLGVDLATGTGWPFGGPWVTEADALHRAVLRDGHLAGEPTRMQVKRAAPGGAGLVLDPYSVTAIEHYLAPIGRALDGLPRGLVRAQFHDSFEYFDASWSPGLAAKFRELHGYDVDAFAPLLLAKPGEDTDTARRVKSDYRATLAALHQDYLTAWAQWSHARGFLVRNQSHGAPANLLDLYGLVDIPETETFGSTPFPIPGLRRDATDVRTGQDLPDPLMMRMASSAAHVMGRPLASSETCTWLREHWKVALAFAKPEIDRLFTAGINHVVYHGTVYSPQDVPWPGWLFYASTQFNPSNPWWNDFAALNAYVTRVQSILQGGEPNNDVLLYWPFADVIDDPRGLMRQYGVHDVGWLRNSPTGRIAQDLLRAGYTFDYVSDAQLALTHAEGKSLRTPGGSYRALLVPATRRLPVETLRQLLALREAGAPVVFTAAPEDVPGLGRLEERRAEFRALLAKANLAPNADAVAAVRALGVTPEGFRAAGLDWIRRRSPLGHDYFVSNLGAQPVQGWVPLAPSLALAKILEPLRGASGEAALRNGSDGRTEIFLQLAPGESLVIRTAARPPEPLLPAWTYLSPAAAAPVTLAGPWHVDFIRGGPALPASTDLSTLHSWTELTDPEAQRFAGTARYRIEFDAPAIAAADWELDLGDVRESARVRLNGTDLGVAWSLPFHVRVGAALRPGRNVLELEVTNLAANRIRDLDRRGVRWKVMEEINFVNINYQPFDASNWPLTPSGLLGPVRLVPLQVLRPDSAQSHPSVP